MFRYYACAKEFLIYVANVQGEPKSGLLLRVDSFVVVGSRKVCDMSKVSKFCLEKCIKLEDVSEIKYSLYTYKRLTTLFRDYPGKLVPER